MAALQPESLESEIKFCTKVVHFEANQNVSASRAIVQRGLLRAFTRDGPIDLGPSSGGGQYQEPSFNS